MTASTAVAPTSPAFPLAGPGELVALLGEETLDWSDFGLCAQTDPELFFPEKGGSVREAKRICSMCEVRGECLDYALVNDEKFGIWGGLSERERRPLRRAARGVRATEGLRAGDDPRPETPDLDGTDGFLELDLHLVGEQTYPVPHDGHHVGIRAGVQYLDTREQM